MEKTSKLEKLKKNYAVLVKKHKIPKFEDINKEFEIEKLQLKETDFLLREIRRTISDKIVAFLKFLELFMNPSSAPLFVLIALKNLQNHTKEKIEETYKVLVKQELHSVKLDVDYKEAEEVKFVKDVLKNWKSFKEDLLEICKDIDKAYTKTSEKNHKGYFG